MTEIKNNGEIWITGSGGFIGRHTVQSLLRAGERLRCFTNRQDGVAVATQPPRLLMDFSNAEDICRCVEACGIPKVFIHIGWGAMTDPGSDEHLRDNALMARMLISTLYSLGLPKFLFLGSANEYGARTGCLSEDMAPEGRMTNYAIAKSEVTAFGLKAAAQNGRFFINVRPFYVYGPGQRPGSLLNKLFACHCEQRKADLGPCEHFRDYVYVGDVAEGVRRLSQLDTSAIVNVGSGKVVRVREFVEYFWRIMGGKPDDLIIGANPMRAGEPEQPLAFADQTRLKSLTGWAPTRSLEEGLRMTMLALQESARGVA